MEKCSDFKLEMVLITTKFCSSIELTLKLVRNNFTLTKMLVLWFLKRLYQYYQKYRKNCMDKWHIISSLYTKLLTKTIKQGKLTHKSVYVIFFQGSQLERRVRYVCEGLVDR